MRKKLSKILSILIFIVVISFSCLSYGVEPENGSIPERPKTEYEKLEEERELKRQGKFPKKYTKEYSLHRMLR